MLTEPLLFGKGRRQYFTHPYFGTYFGTLNLQCTTSQENEMLCTVWQKEERQGFTTTLTIFCPSFGLRCTRIRTGFFVAKVESEANMADEPTRTMTEIFASLEAIWGPPKLPKWLFELWSARPETFCRGEDEPVVAMT